MEIGKQVERVKRMSTVLKKLFEFQKYENNEHLDKVISDTKMNDAQMLSEDELSMVSAAKFITSTDRTSKSGRGKSPLKGL